MYVLALCSYSKWYTYIRKWYVSIALKCKVSFLRRQVFYLLRHLLTLWLTTQGVNIISAAYAQSMQLIIEAFLQSFKIELSYVLMATKGSSWPSISSAIITIFEPLVICEPLVVICVMCDNLAEWPCTVIAYCGLTPARRAARLLIRSLRTFHKLCTAIAYCG